MFVSKKQKKESFSNSFLKKVMGTRNFVWNFLPAIGSAGGILEGVDADILEVVTWEIKNFSIRVVVKNKSNSSIFRIVTVYGDVCRQCWASKCRGL
jgi:hypothetical protein